MAEAYGGEVDLERLIKDMQETQRQIEQEQEEIRSAFEARVREQGLREEAMGGGLADSYREEQSIKAMVKEMHDWHMQMMTRGSHPTATSGASTTT